MLLWEEGLPELLLGSVGSVEFQVSLIISMRNWQFKITEQAKWVFRFFRYPVERRRRIREIGFRKKQDRLLKKLMDPCCEQLLLFIVPGSDPATGKDTISGGVISIVSICEHSAQMKSLHGAEVYCSTLRGEPLLLKHENFVNATPVFRFSQFSSNFQSVKKIIIQLPEYMVEPFLQSLSTADRRWLMRIPERHLNIMNQNILLMPTLEVFEECKRLSTELTITTAHQKYCTEEYRKYYGVPVHKLSVWISPEQYERRPWRQKENLIVVSPDPHPQKERILNQLSAVPGLTVQVIQHLTYEQYKHLLSRAKWSLTFGEGLDGYFIEAIFSGAIGIAVYNDRFFTPDFEALPMVYTSWNGVQSSLIADLQKLEEEQQVNPVQHEQFALCQKYYSQQQYRRNLEAFYQKAYTLT